MDTPMSRLRVVLNNRYVALGLVILFAFIIAFATALIARDRTPAFTTDAEQPSSPTSPRSTTGGYADVTSSGRSESTTAEAPSVFDKITSIFQKDGPASSPTSPATTTASGPKKSSQDSATTQNTPATGGSDVALQTDKPFIPELREAPELPQISIQKYVLTTELPVKPVSAKIYELKTLFTDTDVADRALKLGFERIDAIEKGGSIQKLYDLKNSQYLGFDMSSGHFTFYSEPGVPIPNPTASVTSTALQILRTAGIADSYLIASATYQRKDDTTGSTFVEFHRDWKAIGGPIINPLGLLNLTQKDRLDGVSLGWQSPFAIPDAMTINASDGYNDMLRPDTFNTITVKLSLKNRRVYEVASTMPEIIASERLTDESIISPIEAFTSYTKGATTLGFTGPAGDGDVMLPEVYSNGMAFSKSVDVADFEVIYPEMSEAGPKQWWCPVYALRSFGKVQTGFEVQYAHTVPASRDPRCASATLGARSPSSSSSRTLAQAQAPTVVPTVITGAEKSNSLKYGTIVFKVEAVPDSPSNDCPTDLNHSYVFNQTSDYTDYIAWIDRSVSYQNGTKRRPLASRRIEGPDRIWYFVRKVKSTSNPQLTSISSAYTGAELYNFRERAKAASSQGEGAVAPLDPALRNLDTVFCQYLVTGSPWIYAYAPTPTTLSIVPRPVGDIAYAQPPLLHGGWSVTTTSSNSLTLSTGITKPALHWEYSAKPVQEALRTYRNQHPSDDTRGFIIPTHELQSFIATLSSDMGLNQTERENLIAELQRPSLAFTQPYIKITFASQEFLQNTLPLDVNPQPDSLSRVFIVLQGITAPYSIQQPPLPRISRTGLTVVETGIIRL